MRLVLAMRLILALAVISAAAVASPTGPPAGALALDESVAAGVNCVAGSYFWGRYAGTAYCVACPAGTQSTGCTACSPDPKHTSCIPMGCPAGTFHEFATSGASSTLIDGMDWGPGGVTEGTAEADDAKMGLRSCRPRLPRGSNRIENP